MHYTTAQEYPGITDETSEGPRSLLEANDADVEVWHGTTIPRHLWTYTPRPIHSVTAKWMIMKANAKGSTLLPSRHRPREVPLSDEAIAHILRSCRRMTSRLAAVHNESADVHDLASQGIVELGSYRGPGHHRIFPTDKSRPSKVDDHGDYSYLAGLRLGLRVQCT